MTNERDLSGNVRWLDEVGLHQAVVRGDREAFAELMRRFDPVVRPHIARVTPEELVDAELAKFWCGWIADGFARLRGWEPELGGLLSQRIGVLAAQACAARLSERADDTNGSWP